MSPWKRYARYEYEGNGMGFNKKGHAFSADLSFLDHRTGETVTIHVTPYLMWMMMLERRFPRPWSSHRFIGRIPVTKATRGVLRIEREHRKPEDGNR